MPAVRAGRAGGQAGLACGLSVVMRRIRLTVAYDGTEFHGWQVQPELKTIQGALQAAISEVEGRLVEVAGSGRTDAGVHALAQVAAFTISNPIPTGNLRKALNRLLPRAIRVTGVEEVDAAFHPRFQARSKTYEYRIWRGEVCPPMRRLYVCHHPYLLDESRMICLAPLFEGEHDFTAFAASDEKDALGHSKVRRMIISRMAREGEQLVYRVSGNGFLKHMVRIMIGALVEAGKGNVDEAGLRARLESGYPGKAGPAMPACGLCLMSVEY